MPRHPLCLNKTGKFVQPNDRHANQFVTAGLCPGVGCAWIVAEHEPLRREFKAMKPLSYSLRSTVTIVASFVSLAAGAAVITTDTTVGVTDASLDGQDIVVSNAVFTVDGPHAFNSLRVAVGATLTHSATTSGALTLNLSATNETHVLTDTNPVPLANINIVLASVLVRDTNNIVTYTNDVDYVVYSDNTLQRTANSFIPDGDTVLVSYDYQATAKTGLNLTLTNDFELEAGATVNVAGRGRLGGPGVGGIAGSPLSGAGGGHGGLGGLSFANAPSGSAYDSALTPTESGSSGGIGFGGTGGWGGGVVLLTVGGHCILNGLVTADGQSATNSRAGGGAGRHHRGHTGRPRSRDARAGRLAVPAWGR